MRAVAAGRADAATAVLSFRLKVEAAFRITGRGTVIAGVIEQGTLQAGDELELVQSAEDGRPESRLTRCTGIGGIHATGRDPALGAPIGVLVSDLDPHEVRPGGRLQHR
jgi:translation elongation factor EF-Tu-like GTPase